MTNIIKCRDAKELKKNGTEWLDKVSKKLKLKSLKDAYSFECTLYDVGDNKTSIFFYKKAGIGG